MVAVEQGQAFATQVVEVTRITAVFLAGDEHFGIFQAHVHGLMGNLLPAPLWVLENGHVGAALLEVTEAPLDRRRYQNEVIVLLRPVECIDQLRQQTGIGTLLGAHCVRREMGCANLHFNRFASPYRCRQPEHGQQHQGGQGLEAGRWSQVGHSSRFMPGFA
ncbi:hypothetical protein D9M71_257450 [compost metagenome]